MKLDVGDEVDLRVIHRGVGGITQDDINLAVAPTRSSSASTSGPGQGAGAGRPRRRRDPLLHGDLPGHRRDRGGAQGHAQAGVRRGPARHAPRSARSSGPPSSATSPAASCRSGRSAGTPRPGCCATAWWSPTTCRSTRCAGSRTTRPRSARASSAVSASALEQHRGRGHHRDLRDAGEAAELTHRGAGRMPARRHRGRRADRHVRRSAGAGRAARGRALAEGEAVAWSGRCVAELRRRFEVAVAEAGHLDLHRRALIGVSCVAGDHGHVIECSTLRAAGGRRARSSSCCPPGAGSWARRRRLRTADRESGPSTRWRD